MLGLDCVVPCRCVCEELEKDMFVNRGPVEVLEVFGYVHVEW